MSQESLAEAAGVVARGSSSAEEAGLPYFSLDVRRDSSAHFAPKDEENREPWREHRLRATL